MSDKYSRSELTLGAALRALPMSAPNGDVWSELATKLAPPVRARRARFAVPAALAACALLAIAFVLMRYQAPSTATVAATSPSTVSNATTETQNVNVANAANVANVANDTDGRLTALQLRSRELEQWLHETAVAGTPLPGNDLAAAGEIESLIGIIDVELAAPKQGDAEKLWQRRVNLLEDLTALRYSNYRLAESNMAADQSRTWIN